MHPKFASFFEWMKSDPPNFSFKTNYFRLPVFHHVNTIRHEILSIIMLLRPASMSSGNKGKSIAYSHHLAESSSRNFYAEEASYRKKELMHAEQVKLLDKRLRILEDEAEILKVAFFEDVEERRKLVNEIQNEFQAAFGYTKSQRHGLLQILREESNPAVVIRKLKASDATECVSEFSD